jgi:hypothetical protein
MDDNEKLVLKSIKNYRAQGYTDEQISQAMKNSGIADDVAMKLLHYKPFYFHVAFFVPVILALVFAGVLGAYFLGYFNVESIDEVELNEEVVVWETNFVEDVECNLDSDCGSGYYCSNNDCLAEESQDTLSSESSLSSFSSSGSSSSSRSSGGGSSSSSSGGGGSSSGGGSSDGGSGIVVSAPAVEDCDDQIDNDGDNLVDTFGGCDSDVDEIIDYQCGCLDEGLAKIMNYGDSSLTCDYAYGCVNLSTQEIISGTSCGRGEDIEGVWYNFDNDCEIEEIVTKVEICDDGSDNDDDGLVDCDDIDCVSDEACKSCSDDDDCPTGAACDTSTNECVECVDSDGGSNIYKTGSVTGIFEGDFVYQTLTDYCVDSNTVFEYFCYEASGYFDTEGEIDCGEGYSCVEGACVESSVVVECSDGVDNDGDKKIDYPDDNDCESAEDELEGECTTDDQCGAYTCVNNNCLESCSVDNDCSSIAACDTSTNECVECVDSDGGFDLLTKGTAKGVQFVSRSLVVMEDVCSEGKVNEQYCSTYGEHTYEYYESRSCGSGYACQDGVCFLGCVSDDDCISLQVCDTDTYFGSMQCVDCIMGEDMCEEGYTCEDYVCVAPECSDGRDNDGDGTADFYGMCDLDDGWRDFVCGCDLDGDGSLETGEFMSFKECSAVYGCDLFPWDDDWSYSIGESCEIGVYYSPDAGCDSATDDTEIEEVVSLVEICGNGIDDDADGLIDTYGGCDIVDILTGTTDGRIDFLCGCLDPFGIILLTFGPDTAEFIGTCEDLYGCSELTTGSVTSGQTCTSLGGTWYGFDSDCKPRDAPEIEESFFQKLIDWLIFWN